MSDGTTHYIIHYTLENKSWEKFLAVEEEIKNCGEAWKNHDAPTFIRLDSTLGRVQIQHILRGVLDTENGDTYYIAVLATGIDTNGHLFVKRISGMPWERM